MEHRVGDDLGDAQQEVVVPRVLAEQLGHAPIGPTRGAELSAGRSSANGSTSTLIGRAAVPRGAG